MAIMCESEIVTALVSSHLLSFTVSSVNSSIIGMTPVSKCDTFIDRIPTPSL